MNWLPTSLGSAGMSCLNCSSVSCLQVKRRGLELTQESPAAKAARLTSTARQRADRAQARAQRGQENQPPQAAAASTQPQQSQAAVAGATGTAQLLLHRSFHYSQRQAAPHRAAPAGPPGKLLILACLVPLPHPTNERVRRLQGQDQQQQAAFAGYLLRVGEGTEPTFPDIGQDVVRLKDSMCPPCNSGVSALMQRVYGDVQHCSDPDFLMERSSLTPRNRDVEDINSYMLHRWSGQVCHEQLRLQQQALCRPLGFMKGVCLS